VHGAGEFAPHSKALRIATLRWFVSRIERLALVQVGNSGRSSVADNKFCIRRREL